MKEYEPPFTITNGILEYVSSIMKKIGQLDNYKDFEKMPVLRRNNRIKSIHSSLAIEANSLSFNQVKDVIEGKIVLGNAREIQEVKNAYSAYQMIDKYNPYSIEDLKKAHGLMTHLTVERSGKFRIGGEGVFDENNNCIFMAPTAEMVPELMNSLFEWMKKNKETVHPLILSSVFHYEFVFIHPFSDGNGRMARLWQNVILSNWEEIFEYIPIESQIKKFQFDYYDAIQKCNLSGNSTVFIEFILKMIDEVLDELIMNTDNQINHISLYVNKLLDIMEPGIYMTSKELMNKINLKSNKSFRENYLQPAIKSGLIRMTKPDKPTSKNQMYYKI